MGFFNKLWGGVKNVGKGVFKAVTAIPKGIAEGVTGKKPFFKAIFGGVKDTLGGIGQAASGAIKAFTPLGWATTAIGGKVESTFDNVTNIGAQAVAGIVGGGALLGLAGIGGGGIAALRGAISLAGAIPGAVGSVLGTTGSTLASVGGKVLPSALGFIPKIFGKGGQQPQIVEESPSYASVFVDPAGNVIKMDPGAAVVAQTTTVGGQPVTKEETILQAPGASARNANFSTWAHLG